MSTDIPKAVRQQVLLRDGHCCMVCGRTDELVCHHADYGGTSVGMGGHRVHDPERIVTLGGGLRHTCHQRVHENKAVWTPLLLWMAHWRGLGQLTFVNALTIMRWVLNGATLTGIDDNHLDSIRTYAQQNLRRH